MSTTSFDHLTGFEGKMSIAFGLLSTQMKQQAIRTHSLVFGASVAASLKHWRLLCWRLEGMQ